MLSTDRYPLITNYDSDHLSDHNSRLNLGITSKLSLVDLILQSRNYRESPFIAYTHYRNRSSFIHVLGTYLIPFFQYGVLDNVQMLGG